MGQSKNIICFAKDWNEDPTSNNHVMLELAKSSNKVLWLNSLATRTPNLASARDLKKIILKLGRFFRGAKEVRPNLWVYTPIVIPLPHSRWATKINRAILRLTLKLLRRRLGMKQFELWAFLPSVADYVGTLGETLSVYYCTDEYSKFSYVNGERMAAAEREMLRRADIVFATAQSLVDARIAANPETHLARHGVDHPKFAEALRDDVAVPADIANLPKPVLGFYGTIQSWIDFDLIANLARRHPEWSIVLIGTALADTSKIRDLPNVHLLGRRPHDQLPAYCKGFDVGLIPYILDERVLHVNPIKLREYLSAGLPVVSAAMPEVQQYSHLCATARTPEEFERAIEKALQTNSREQKLRRSEAMASESWSRRVADLVEHVERVQRSRQNLQNEQDGRSRCDDGVLGVEPERLVGAGR